MTACFAAGAAAGRLTEEELCERVARSMQQSGASFHEQAMALVAAASKGRYKIMVSAMREAKMEPVLIEDLIEIGKEMGFEAGREQGIAQGREQERRSMLLKQLTLRFGRLPESAASRVNTAGAADLEAMSERVLTAKDLAEVVGA